MKKYNKPAIEICSFDVKDIITLSTGETTVGGLSSSTEATAAIKDLTSKVGELGATNVSVFKW